jgi:dTDP-glucose 4,6-dehydratase
LNILQAALKSGDTKVVHTSTSEVYGTARQIPITEEHPLQAQSPYSATKIGADKLVESFIASFALPGVVVRPFNTFGPRQSERAIIPTIIAQVLRGERRLRLGNLNPTRDLNYVANTVDGFLAAAVSEAALGRTIHFGSGREISIGDLAALIADLCGVKIEIEKESTRQRAKDSEVERLIADPSLARRLLGWEPKVCLEDGLIRVIEWMKTQQWTDRTEYVR